MESLLGTSAIRTLRKMIKKGLIKEGDLNIPPDGWFMAMGYERELGTGKWYRVNRTLRGARPSIPIHKIPKYKNVLTGKITFDPVEYEKQY